MTRPHAAVVYNPMKASRDDLRTLVAREQQRLSWTPSRWYPTDSDDSGRRAAQAAIAGSPAVLLVAGGDGTLRASAEAANNTNIPVAIIPLGTGNLLARNLGLPLKNLDASVSAAFSGTSGNIDVGVVQMTRPDGTRDRQVFLVMAGIGLDAEMAEHTNPTVKRWMGWAAYAAPIAKSVLVNRHFSMRYRIENGPALSSRAHTLIIGNCGTLAGRMLLFPEAVIDDGLLDLVLMRPGGRSRWAQIGARLTAQGIAKRTHLGRRIMRRAPAIQALTYAQGRQIDLRFETPHTLQLDGDTFGAVTSARFTVQPSALRICGLL